MHETVQIITPSFKIESTLDGDAILKDIERYGRTCYKSEDKITEDSAKKFVKMIMKRGHVSVIEHVSATVRIICDRGVTHEIVRHRLASYSQESTRYCNYSSSKFGNEIKVIDLMPFLSEDQLPIWLKAMSNAENAYLDLLAAGASPQIARSVLPNSLKTEIVVTYNLREWMHFFSLRAASPSHPQMREIACPLLAEFRKRIPIIFDHVGDPDCGTNR